MSQYFPELCSMYGIFFMDYEDWLAALMDAATAEYVTHTSVTAHTTVEAVLFQQK